MILKILTAQIREEKYYSLINRRLFPNEQKGCNKGSRSIAESIYIDQHILNESKNRRNNLAMAWVDNKKVYDIVPQSWIINCLKMYKISHKTTNSSEKNPEKLETWIKSRRKKLGWNKDPKRDFPRRCTITTTVHNCHDTTKPHTQKMHSWIQT